MSTQLIVLRVLNRPPKEIVLPCLAGAKTSTQRRQEIRLGVRTAFCAPSSAVSPRSREGRRLVGGDQELLRNRYESDAWRKKNTAKFHGVVSRSHFMDTVSVNQVYIQNGAKVRKAKQLRSFGCDSRLWLRLHGLTPRGFDAVSNCGQRGTDAAL